MTTFLSDNIDEHSPFPDGQPHLKDKAERNVHDWVTCRITCSDDLVRLGMLVAIRQRKREPIQHLRILYLMGGRMDRALSRDEPYTLKVVCDFINSLNIPRVSVFCPHSTSTPDLLDNADVDYWSHIEDAFYDKAAIQFLRGQSEDFKGGDKQDVRMTDQLSFVFPDLGAQKRFSKSNLLKWWPNANLVTLHKDREERTGKILGTRIISGVPSKYCLIVDDLCDGGATFVHAAKVLRGLHVTAVTESGVAASYTEKVGLAVCHGIFSKGLPLEGIDFVATTNSFRNHEPQDGLWVQNFV